jgi:hypothetical protein
MSVSNKRPPEAFRSSSFKKQGIGHVVITRFKAGGTEVDAGVFLVDAYCLGVKDAIFRAVGHQRVRG